MKLLVSLLRNAFLDEVEDEKMWNQINLLALASNTSAEVRKNALYFIMEQLEAFDDTDDRANHSYESKHEQQLVSSLLSQHFLYK